MVFIFQAGNSDLNAFVCFMATKYTLNNFTLLCMFCSICRSRYLQLCVCSVERGGVSDSVHAGGRAMGPQEKTP